MNLRDLCVQAELRGRERSEGTCGEPYREGMKPNLPKKAAQETCREQGRHYLIKQVFRPPKRAIRENKNCRLNVQLGN